MNLLRNQPAVGLPIVLQATGGGALDPLPTGGTFALAFYGEPTAELACNATAAEVEAALQGIGSLAGAIACGGGPLPATPILIEFVGDQGGTDVPLLTATAALVGGIAPVEVLPESIQTGGGGRNAVQGVAVTSASGGSFYLTYQGATSAAIAYNASATEVQAALEAIAALAGNVSGSGGPLGETNVAVEFLHALARQDLPTLGVDAAGLEGEGASAAAWSIYTGAAGVNAIQRLRIAHGAPTAVVVRDGGAPVPVAAAPQHKGNGLWCLDLSAAETDAAVLGVLVHAAGGAPALLAITTATPDATAPTATEIVAALLDGANAVEAGVTVRQYLRRSGAVLCGKVTGAGSGVETFWGMDGAGPRLIGTIDAEGNRTEVVCP